MNILIPIADWMEKHSLPCYYKKIIGLDCPFCGAQRAFIEILHGNFHQSFSLYPAMFPILFMMGFLLIHITMEIKDGNKILKILLIFNVSIVLISYIIKLFHG